jgi:hypothetical protein
LPHGKTLVREQHFAVDAVGGEVLQPFLGRLAGLIAQPVLPRTVRRGCGSDETLGLLELFAFRVDADPWQAVVQVFRHPLHPEVVRFLHVAIGRDDEEFVRVVGPRRALPAVGAGRIETPRVVVVDGVI